MHRSGCFYDYDYDGYITVCEDFVHHLGVFTNNIYLSVTTTKPKECGWYKVRFTGKKLGAWVKKRRFCFMKSQRKTLLEEKIKSNNLWVKVEEKQSLT